MHELYSLFRLLVFTLASLHVYVVASRNDDIHLAVRPRCGSFSGNYTNVNAGLVARKFNTIVAFGVSHDSLSVVTKRISFTAPLYRTVILMVAKATDQPFLRQSWYRPTQRQAVDQRMA